MHAVTQLQMPRSNDTIRRTTLIHFKCICRKQACGPAKKTVRISNIAAMSGVAAVPVA
jgi:hypothetical protein